MFRSGYCARSWDTVVLGDYHRHTVRQLQLTLTQALYYCSISWSNIEVVWCGVGFCFFEDPGSGHRSVRWQWCYSINSTRNCRHVHLPPRFARRYISQRSFLSILLRVAGVASVVAVPQLRPSRQYQHILVHIIQTLYKLLCTPVYTQSQAVRSTRRR